TDSASLINRINRQMINVSAASVVTAQCDANNRRAIACHSAQSGVACEKVGNAFSVITLSDLETLDSLPQLKRRRVIANRKFSRGDLALHVRCKNSNLLYDAVALAGIKFSGSSNLSRFRSS